MNTLLVRTDGNADPKGKPKVYFTCHPDDFESCFDAVCEELFAAYDCAVYYRENMAESLPAETRGTDLNRMNLFVIPVTFRLLNTGNVAMDEDFPFAKNAYIPVLPLMREQGLVEVYSLPQKFGTLQYLDPTAHDATAIDYSEKLKHYLNSVLISDDTAQRVRAAFDAYIFLSYRKKDRQYANTLMRLIHANPLCRDIAIWYDEYLTPGESFNSGISKALERSDLFTLLVTPNLVDEMNYVLTDEYPAAVKAGKKFFGAEAVKTDPKTVQERFPELTDGAVSIDDTDEFHQRLLATIRRLGLTANDQDPAHNFLIGLAYLDGIDVEVNRDRALEMITSSAEADLPEAMQKLVSIYQEGIGTKRNYQEALHWSETYADHCARNYDKDDIHVADAQHSLAVLCGIMGDYHRSLDLHQKVYERHCRILGEDSDKAIDELACVAAGLNGLGEFRRALEINQKVYSALQERFGEEHPDTLNALRSLAVTYLYLGEYSTARSLQEEDYEIRRRIDGEKHNNTLIALNNLAVTCSTMGDLTRALKYTELSYRMRSEVSGEDHLLTLSAKTNLAEAHRKAGYYQTALEMEEEIAAKQAEVLGEEHPLTLTTLANMAVTCNDLLMFDRAAELNEKVWSARRRVLGEEHPSTLTSQDNVAVSLINRKKYRDARAILLKLKPLAERVLGEDHPTTLNALTNLAFAYGMLGDKGTAREMQEDLYERQCRVLGETHPSTLNTLNSLAFSYSGKGDKDKAMELFEKAYRQRLATLGPEHSETMRSLNNLSVTAFNFHDHETAVRWADELCACTSDAIQEFLDNMAIVYKNCGEFAKAKAVEARKK